MKMSKYSSFHNASTMLSMSVTQRRANPGQRNDTIVSNNGHFNLFSKAVTEAKGQMKAKDFAITSSYQKQKNVNKKKRWSEESSSTQLDGLINKAKIALESVLKEEENELADARSTHNKLKETYRELKAERTSKFEALVVDRRVYSMFSEELEELRKDLQSKKE